MEDNAYSYQVPVRRAIVNNRDPLGQISLYFPDSGAGGSVMPPPVLGGATTGFHTMPNIADEVAILHEWPNRPFAAISVVEKNQLSLLPSLAPGESVTIAADGRQVGYLKSDGSTLLYNKPSGATITVATSGNVTVATPAAGNIALNAGSGGTITGTGAATLNQTLAVTGVTTLSGNVQQAAGGGTWGVTAAGVATFGTLGAAATTVTTLHATGAATLDSTLGVTGTSTLGTLNAGSTGLTALTVTGTTSLNGSSTVFAGVFSANSGTAFVRLDQSGNATLAGTVSTGPLNINSNTLSGLATMNGSGAITLTSTGGSNINITTTGNVNVTNSIGIGGSLNGIGHSLNVGAMAMGGQIDMGNQSIIGIFSLKGYSGSGILNLDLQNQALKFSTVVNGGSKSGTSSNSIQISVGGSTFYIPYYT